MKILIIDDEDLIRRAIHRVLTSDDIQIFEASDGQKGIELWMNVKPDIVFLDYLMPYKSGLEVLKAIPENLKCHVIVISAFVGEEEKKQFKEAGAKLFYHKPFDDIRKFKELVKIHG